MEICTQHLEDLLQVVEEGNSSRQAAVTEVGLENIGHIVASNHSGELTNMMCSRITQSNLSITSASQHIIVAIAF